MKAIVCLIVTVFAVGLLSGCEHEHHYHGDGYYHREPYGGPAPGSVIGQGYYRDGYYYDQYGRRWER